MVPLICSALIGGILGYTVGVLMFNLNGPESELAKLGIIVCTSTGLILGAIFGTVGAIFGAVVPGSDNNSNRDSSKDK